MTKKKHITLIKHLNLKSKAYNAAGGKTLKELVVKELQPINDECWKLKCFLSKHKGINKDNIQDYLNLYSFITNCKMKDENLCFVSNLLLKLLFLADKKIKFSDVVKQKNINTLLYSPVFCFIMFIGIKYVKKQLS